ncbi:hypothetical protein M569_15055, partial [Genlisea aurea]
VVEVDDDDISELRQRIDAYNIDDSSPDRVAEEVVTKRKAAPKQKKRATLKVADDNEDVEILDDDDDDDFDLAGERTTRKQPPEAKKGPAKKSLVNQKPDKKVRRLRESPFNKKSSSVLNDEPEKETWSSMDVAVVSRPRRANRVEPKTYFTINESSESDGIDEDESEFDEDD